MIRSAVLLALIFCIPFLSAAAPPVGPYDILRYAASARGKNGLAEKGGKYSRSRVISTRAGKAIIWEEERWSTIDGKLHVIRRHLDKKIEGKPLVEKLTWDGKNMWTDIGVLNVPNLSEIAKNSQKQIQHVGDVESLTALTANIEHYVATIEKTELSGGKRQVILKISKFNMPEVFLWIDTADWMLIKSEWTPILVPGLSGGSKETTIFTDYRRIGKCMLPGKIVTTREKSMTEWQIKEEKFLDHIDENLFKKPK
jgi:hypothetical protein